MYGLEMLFINKTQLKKMDQAQTSLIKANIGLSKFARSSALMYALEIDQIHKLYEKYKIIFMRQILRNYSTKYTFEYLTNFYQNRKIPEQSYIAQIENINTLIGHRITEIGTKESIKLLKSKQNIIDTDLVCKIRDICSLIASNKEDFVHYRNILAQLLYN